MIELALWALAVTLLLLAASVIQEGWPYVAGLSMHAVCVFAQLLGGR